MPLTRTLTSMGSSGLAKLSCTPAQHTGMLVVLSSVGGAVTLGGTSGCGFEERVDVSNRLWHTTTVTRTHRGLGAELTEGCWSQQS